VIVQVQVTYCPDRFCPVHWEVMVWLHVEVTLQGPQQVVQLNCALAVPGPMKAIAATAMPIVQALLKNRRREKSLTEPSTDHICILLLALLQLDPRGTINRLQEPPTVIRL